MYTQVTKNILYEKVGGSSSVCTIFVSAHMNVMCLHAQVHASTCDVCMFFKFIHKLVALFGKSSTLVTRRKQ